MNGTSDGGEPEDASINPLDLPSHCDPAVIQAKTRSNGQEVTEKVCIANVDVLDSGAVRVRQWDGRTKVVPEWRWCTIIYLRTEDYDKSPDDADSHYVHAERVIKSDREYIPVDTTPTREEVTA